ncbi:MAG: TetR/AcrR family transcriptional regulator [Armatimonadetes bacterium]|nr:TetR/AcrR family transcriptional regulator [Armatimonadota bacterium]
MVSKSAPSTDDTRDVILDAANRLFARYGYRKTTVDDLAREAGIGKGSVYLHFPSKQEVALSLIDRVNVELQEQLRAILREGSSPELRLRKMLEARVLVRFDAVQHFTESLDDIFADLRPQIMERREGYHRVEAQLFATLLEEARANEQMQFDSAQNAAYSLLIATASLLPYSLSAQQLGDRDEIIRKVRRLAELMLRGLLSR